MMTPCQKCNRPVIQKDSVVTLVALYCATGITYDRRKEKIQFSPQEESWWKEMEKLAGGEAHIRCVPAVAQYIVAPQFGVPVVDRNHTTNKQHLWSDDRKTREGFFTAAFLEMLLCHNKIEEPALAPVQLVLGLPASAPTYRY